MYTQIKINGSGKRHFWQKKMFVHHLFGINISTTSMTIDKTKCHRHYIFNIYGYPSNLYHNKKINFRFNFPSSVKLLFINNDNIK